MPIINLYSTILTIYPWAKYRLIYILLLPPSYIVHLVKGSDLAIIACGYMVHKALGAQKILEERGVSAGVIDLFRIKRVNAKGLAETLSQYAYLVTVEEQILEGGFSSAVIEALSALNVMMQVC